MLMPSALAALRFRNSSTFVLCWTGRSAGFALENPAGIYSDEAMSICNARPAVHQAECDYGWLLDRAGQRRRLRVMNPGGGDVENLTTPIRGPPPEPKPELILFCNFEGENG